jgi:hypothetical protein
MIKTPPSLSPRDIPYSLIFERGAGLYPLPSRGEEIVGAYFLSNLTALLEYQKGKQDRCCQAGQSIEHQLGY